MNQLKPYAGIALATGIVALFAVLAGQGAQVNEAYVDALFWMAIGGGIGATAVKARGPKFGPWIEGEPREYELRESAHPGELIPETFDDVDRAAHRPHPGNSAVFPEIQEDADGPEVGGVRPRMEARRPGEGEGDREGLGGR